MLLARSSRTGRGCWLWASLLLGVLPRTSTTLSNCASCQPNYPSSWPSSAAVKTSQITTSKASLERSTGTVVIRSCCCMMPALTSSDESTKLFNTRLGLITAFLYHDPGEPGHGGAAQAATTSWLPANTASQPLSVSQLSSSDLDRTAAVLILKAQYAARWWDTEKQPPRYYSSQDMPDVFGHIC